MFCENVIVLGEPGPGWEKKKTPKTPRKLKKTTKKKHLAASSQ